MTASPRLPTLFIPHGGGPCFFMDPMPGTPAGLWDGMAAYLRSIPHTIGPSPKAVLVISGHWECERPTIHFGEQHSLYYDYSGFPSHTYELQWPAKGSPQLAARVRELLNKNGLETDEERERGLDHGVFIPFMLIFPQADVPVVQLSLQRGLDPATHVEIGKALEPLRDEAVLIVGTGMSYHNLRKMFVDEPDANQDAENFDLWLRDTVTSDARKREHQLKEWRSSPGALASHPRSEHLLPLMVVAGAAGTDEGHVVYNERLMGKMISGFQFGEGHVPTI